MFPAAFESIDTASMPRVEWLDLRRTGLGGSDAAAACGLSRWRTPLGLYFDKRGELDEQQDNDSLKWGRKLEPLILEAASEATGLEMREHKALIRSAEWPFAFVDLDGVVMEDGKPVGIVECKTAAWVKAEEWGAQGGDLVPQEYALQCQHAMAVTGMPFCILAVLIGGSQFRWYRLERDDALIAKLMRIEAAFWQRVVSGTPPETDYGRDYQALAKVYGGGDGSEVDLPADASRWHDAMTIHSEAEKQHAAGKDGSKARIIDMMHGASVGHIPGVGSYYYDKRGTLRFRKEQHQ